MKIETRPVWSKLVGADAKTFAYLEDQFKTKVPGARYIPSVRAGHWDGYVRYFKPLTGIFLTGFLPEVLLHLEDLGLLSSVQVERMYAKPKPGAPLPVVEEFTPRDYQTEIARDAVRAMRGVIKAATNAGKTEIAMMIAQRLGLPMLYIAAEQTLWAQTYDRFVRRFGTKLVGRIGAGVWEPKFLTIGMAQSVAPKLGMFRGRSTVFEKNVTHVPQVIIVDEVHMYTGGKKKAKDPLALRRGPKSHWQLILENIQAPYRYGMSGTPLNEVDTRDRNLMGLTGPMLSEVSNRDLVDMGYSAVPRITFVRYDGRTKKMDWQDAYRELVVHSDARNTAIADICWAHHGKQVLILTSWAQHGRIIKQTLNAHDVTAVFLSGQDSVWHRQKWLKAFANREIQAIVATTIFDQGVDVPAIDVLVMAGAGGVSPIKPLQRLGRGLRKRPDKDEVLVYDFEDRYQEDLEKHTKRRVQLFKREKFPVAIKTIEQIKEEYAS